MLPSVRAMFAGIIDYAGMFPPAQLPLEQAIRNYARYWQEPEGWMLGRFICPATRLAELSPFVEELFRDGPPLVVSALGSGGCTISEFGLALADELKDIVHFQQSQGSHAIVDTFETQLPGLGNFHGCDEGLRQIVFGPDAWLQANGIPPVSFYYIELPFDDAGRFASGSSYCFFKYLPTLLGTLIRDPERRKGFKFRCGGTGRAAVPSAKDTAMAIKACRVKGVPLKFTAGLHHPIRHWNDQLKTHLHGFLNVFVSGVLNHATEMEIDKLEPILEDENAGDFAFDSEGLRWRDRRATIAEIESARRHAVTSFGSCSFDEPRDGLRAMGLLP